MSWTDAPGGCTFRVAFHFAGNVEGRSCHLCGVVPLSLAKVVRGLVNER